MKYTLYYAHAKLKAVKGKKLRGNKAIVHLSIILKKKHLVTRRKENRQIGVYIFALNRIKKIREGLCYVCCVCNRLLYKRSVHIFGKSKYSCQNVFNVQSSFDGKQTVCL